MRMALKIFLVLISIGLGVISCGLGLNILMSFGQPGFKVYDPGPRGKQILLLSMIIIAYSILLFLVYRNKKNSETAMIALFTFIISIIVTPVIIVYSVDIHDFFMTPSHRTQMSIQGEIQKIIQENNLPYTLDSKESEKQTKHEVIRTVILLRKITGDAIQEKEVDLLIKNSPSTNLRLVLYERNQQEHVTVVLNKDRSIYYCEPIEFCK
ncbi:hypothetical protein [Paenibacillus thiaminolyticus]|uniref:hypothetical protein n=1 Tax=Paenibacillus thiaminolyticus TaxID=49283 RepID=UPI002543AEA1|nr:hypothetical protein [Paenibacillus thiaminolyticus]WII38708.1 hypothetical protein O0V01_06245 [Paenibacillus thiaminolyticus]